MVNVANFEELRKEFEASWPPIIARDEIARYTGGMYSANTMQVYDSKGLGVKNKVRQKGRKIGYRKKELIDWFLSQLEAVNEK